MKPLVSIISPCYNGETYVSKFLDSILRQHYSNIELFIINDGSTDKTEEVIQSYKPKFDAKNYRLYYLYQKHSGQSAAINQALPLFKGEYMTWPDSDDYLSSDAIEKRVAFMEANPDKGLCLSNTMAVDYDTGEMLREYKRTPPGNEDSLFEDLISGHSYYPNGGFLVRSSMFRDALPSMQIADPPEIGQNLQLLLPITYKYSCGYIDECLYYYRVRTNSHSQTERTFEEQMRIINEVAFGVFNAIVEEIESNPNKLHQLKRLVNINCLQKSLNVLVHFERKDNLNQIIDELKELNAYDREARHNARFLKCLPYRILIKTKRKLTSLFA